ncbi:MAG: glycosyltransferase family 87 protein [Fuerstiella sp.]
MALTLLSFVMVFVAVTSSQPLQSANDRSRWCTVWSLVERGTYQIDEIDQVPGWSTIDKVRHRLSDDEPWHFYSSKPPLFPTVVAGLYWVERHTLGYDLREHPTFVSRLLLVLVNVIPFLAALLCLRRSLRQARISNHARWFVLAAAGFGSMLNPFLTTLNNHTPAAICVMFCLAAIIRIRSAEAAAAKDYAVVGLTAALTCCLELPAALFGLLSFVLVVKRDWKTTARWYVPAAIIPLAAFFVTNWICTGGMKPFYAYYGTEKYVYVHEGVPSYWSQPQGIDANDESPGVYLFHCILGHHGVLALTPVFVLTGVGWWMGLRTDRRSVFRVVWWLGAGLSFVILSFYLSRTQNYNYGGNSSALRWMLWLIPFWWYGMIPAVERLCTTRRGLVLCMALLVPSIYSPVYSRTTPWQPSWVFLQMARAGWIDYGTKVPPFAPARYSVLGELPTTPDSRSEWTNGTRRFSLRVMYHVELNDQPAWLMSLTDKPVVPVADNVNDGTPPGDRHHTLIVLPNERAAGKDISAWLKAVNLLPSRRNDFKEISSKTLSAPAPEIVQLLRGLPSSRPYNAESPRYFKYTRPSGQKWALRCERGASRVAFEDSKRGRCWQRCDVMYCDQLPFGVVQWRITVVEDSTNTVLRTETWTCTTLP